MCTFQKRLFIFHSQCRAYEFILARAAQIIDSQRECIEPLRWLCTKKLCPVPISELVLFKFNEKRLRQVPNKMESEAIFALERKRLLIHVTFCSPPLFVCSGMYWRCALTERERPSTKSRSLATNSSCVHLVLLSESWAERTNHANFCSFCLPPGWNLAWIHLHTWVGVSHFCTSQQLLLRGFSVSESAN